MKKLFITLFGSMPRLVLAWAIVATGATGIYFLYFSHPHDSGSVLVLTIMVPFAVIFAIGIRYEDYLGDFKKIDKELTLLDTLILNEPNDAAIEMTKILAGEKSYTWKTLFKNDDYLDRYGKKFSQVLESVVTCKELYQDVFRSLYGELEENYLSAKTQPKLIRVTAILREAYTKMKSAGNMEIEELKEVYPDLTPALYVEHIMEYQWALDKDKSLAELLALIKKASDADILLLFLALSDTDKDLMSAVSKLYADFKKNQKD